MLTDNFAGHLFGPGQPLDQNEHFIILPDSLGTGNSAKPSDGLMTKFPQYNYDDMVQAQYQLVTEHFGINHLRLVIGNSMGGMHVWLWGIRHPRFMDALIPMACQPCAMSGRNWMMRRMLIDAIRSDPEWCQGYYSVQPPSLRKFMAWFTIASSGGNQRLQRIAPTRVAADAYVNNILVNQNIGDANDTLYQWEAAADYDPSSDLGSIKSYVLAINSADDERNTLELGVLENLIQRLEKGDIHIIPSTPFTQGHATTGLQAYLYAKHIQEFLDKVPYDKKLFEKVYTKLENITESV